MHLLSYKQNLELCPVLRCFISNSGGTAGWRDAASGAKPIKALGLEPHKSHLSRLPKPKVEDGCQSTWWKEKKIDVEIFPELRESKTSFSVS